MAKGLIWLTGLVFICYSITFTFAPAAMLTWVTGDSPGTASSIIDLRATYRGMSISVGVIILILIIYDESISLALLVTAIALLTMAITRAVGIFLDGSPNIFMYVYLTTEIIISVVALWLRKSVKCITDTQQKANRKQLIVFANGF